MQLAFENEQESPNFPFDSGQLSQPTKSCLGRSSIVAHRHFPNINASKPNGMPFGDVAGVVPPDFENLAI